MNTCVDLPIYRIRESDGSFTIQRIRIELTLEIESRGSFLNRKWFIDKLQMISRWKPKIINESPNNSGYWLELPMFFDSKDKAEAFIKKEMYPEKTEKFHYVS